MRRYIKLFVMFVKQSTIKLLSYRTNFFMILFTHLGYFGVQLMFMNVIFRNVETLAGWSKYEMFFYIGTCNLIDALMIAAPFFNIMSLPYMVNSGMLDLYLTKPVGLQFLLSFRTVEISAVSSLISAAAIITYSLSRLGKTLTLAKVIFYLFTVCNGILIQYSILFMLSSLAFWTIKADFVYQVDLIANYYITKPVDIYKGVIGFILRYILPYGLMFTVCAKSAIKGISWTEYAIFFAFSWGLFIASKMFLKLSIHHYGSASS